MKQILYSSVVKRILLYGSEAKKITKAEGERLLVAEMNALRRS